MASMAVSHANGVVVELVHDVSFTRYTIDLLAFDDTLTLELQSGGGFVGRFVP